jgi:hypothetical protein
MKTLRVELELERSATSPSEKPSMSIEDVLHAASAPTSPAAAVTSGVVIADFVGFSGGSPLIHFHDDPAAARRLSQSIVPLDVADVGKQVAVQFEKGNISRPIIMGLLHTRPESVSVPRDSSFRQIQVDNDQLVITAEKQITLRCGKSSITLTRGGKIVIRGEYVLSRASGENRIIGGSVQLN